MSRYKHVHYGTDEKGCLQTFHSVGIAEDGRLWNPNNYPDDLVRTAVTQADERRRARRLARAKQATVTRQRRRERKVYQIAERITAGLARGPRQSCAICGRHLIDHESIHRGIGPECWQDIY